jgi:CRP/FNR family transcriptional regulator, nitrogen oxide reductase regulator
MARRSPITIPSADPHACSHDVRVRALAAAPLFRSLTVAALTEVDARCGMRGVAAGEAVHLAGRPAQRLYVVATGSVKLTRATADGAEVLVDVLGSGGFLGALPALGEETYREAAWALTPGCLLSLTTADLDAVMDAHPVVARDALAAVGRRLRVAQASVERAASASVEERLAATLLLLAARLGRRHDGATLIDAPLSRDELASLAGCAPETASRLLARWEREDHVRTGRRWVAIVDRAALEALTRA